MWQKFFSIFLFAGSDSSKASRLSLQLAFEIRVHEDQFQRFPVPSQPTMIGIEQNSEQLTGHSCHVSSEQVAVPCPPQHVLPN